MPVGLRGIGLRRRALGLALALTLAVGACTAAPPANRASATDEPVPATGRSAAAAAAVASPALPIVHVGREFPPSLQSSARDAYRLQPGDELEIRDPDWPQFDVATRVRPDGRISVPYAGTLEVADRSPEDVRELLIARLRAEDDGAQPARYLLQAGDEIELKFPYAAEVNERVTIRPDGWVQLQLVGAIEAQGRTPEALRDELQRRYAVYLRKPDLSVIVRATVNQRVRVGDRWRRAGLSAFDPQVIVRNAPPRQVFVGGEVARPGVIAYRSGLTLMQATIEAGGRLPGADLSRVVVVRRSDQGAAVIERDLRAMLARDGGRDGVAPAVEQDVVLRPSDVVVYPQSRVASIGEALNEYVFKNVPFLRNGAMSFTYLFNGSTSVR